MHKFQLPRIPNTNHTNYGRAVDYIENLEEEIYPQIRELEHKSNLLLNTLIKTTSQLENSEYQKSFNRHKNVLEEVLEIPWSKIRELIITK